MRIVVVALTVISVTFAATTVYFARELRLERERPAAITAPGVQSAPVIAAEVSLPRTTSAPNSQQTLTPQSPTSESEQARMDTMQLEHGRRIVRMLEDPEQREGMLVEAKMMMRNSYPRLAQTLGLSSDEADRLFTLLAHQQIEAQERYARCTLDPSCNSHDGTRAQNEPRVQDIANLLGADRQQQFDNYKNTLMERASVNHLRTRLSDSTRLPDETAESLISALAEERQKIHQEAAARGVGMNGYGTGVGMVFSASDAASAEAQYESAQANSRRMRERAALVLTTEQLRVFDEMQDELLISLKHQARQKEDLTLTSSYATATVVN